MAELISSFKERFSKAMSIRAITPTELKDKTGISLATISQYTSGYSKPKTERTNLIANALSVDPAWLMGFDVPMERNDYEDQKLITFDTILGEAIKVLENSNYKVILPEEDGSIITIAKKDNKIIAYVHDYEIVNKYESLKRASETITGDSLISSTSIEEYHLESFASRSFGIDCLNEYLNYDCSNIINVMSVLNKQGLKEAEKRIVELQYIPQYKASTTHDFSDIFTIGESGVSSHDSLGNEIKAAHERTNIEVTEEMRQHDDDIMNDDSEWE